MSSQLERMPVMDRQSGTWKDASPDDDDAVIAILQNSPFFLCRHSRISVLGTKHRSAGSKTHLDRYHNALSRLASSVYRPLQFCRFCRFTAWTRGLCIVPRSTRIAPRSCILTHFSLSPLASILCLVPIAVSAATRAVSSASTASTSAVSASVSALTRSASTSSVKALVDPPSSKFALSHTHSLTPLCIQKSQPEIVALSACSQATSSPHVGTNILAEGQLA